MYIYTHPPSFRTEPFRFEPEDSVYHCHCHCRALLDGGSRFELGATLSAMGGRIRELLFVCDASRSTRYGIRGYLQGPGRKRGGANVIEWCAARIMDHMAMEMCGAPHLARVVAPRSFRHDGSADPVASISSASTACRCGATDAPPPCCKPLDESSLKKLLAIRLSCWISKNDQMKMIKMFIKPYNPKHVFHTYPYLYLCLPDECLQR